MTKLRKMALEYGEQYDAWGTATVAFEAGFNAAQIQLNRADEIILDIHAEITTFSKYTASRVYDWKDIRGEDGSPNLKEFDDNGRDEDEGEL